MNAKDFIQSSMFSSLITSILDLENSNLPIDYFTSVLPRAQYGEEGAVSVGLNDSDAVLRIFDSADNTKGVILNFSSSAVGDNMQIANQAPVNTPDGYVSRYLLMVLMLLRFALLLRVVFLLVLAVNLLLPILL